MEIPSLEEFRMKGNPLGIKGVEYICNFLRENTTLSVLEFNGKNYMILHW
jgi:hypothetical protein